LKGVTGMIGSYALTTFDNPYDPFEQFSDWFLFDMEKGYNTCAYLARIARTSDQFTDEENEREVERAINEIIRYDFMNIYKKVSRKKEAV
jgi:hypothetical protein